MIRMKKTIRWRILKYNLVVVFAIICLTSIIFNVAIRWYLKQEMMGQLNRIATLTEHAILKPAPNIPAPWLPPENSLGQPDQLKLDNELIRYYLMLNRTLREPLTVLNADYILVDRDMNRVTLFPDDFFNEFNPSLDQILHEVTRLMDFRDEDYLEFGLLGQDYTALVKPITQQKNSNLGWIIIFSPVDKIKQLQLAINLILLAILLFTALIAMLISSLLPKKYKVL